MRAIFRLCGHGLLLQKLPHIHYPLLENGMVLLCDNVLHLGQRSAMTRTDRVCCIARAITSGLWKADYCYLKHICFP